MDWKKTLATVAPALATALGGPLAGTAVKYIGDRVLDQPEASEDDIAQALAAPHPDLLLRLKQADHAFKIEMKKLDVDVEQIHSADRANARAREIQSSDWMPKTLALLLILGFFGVLSGILLYGLPLDGGEALLILLGALTGAFGAVVQYYFGSSSGSSRKNDILERLRHRSN